MHMAQPDLITLSGVVVVVLVDVVVNKTMNKVKQLSCKIDSLSMI